MAFAEDYVDVATRLRIFKERHPEGSLQPVRPIEVITIGDQTFLAYVAAAYRSPDDQRPGIGTAWEPFPGKTPYTRDSEAMNAESSAWGRAIVAVLAADTKKGVASAEEVRNRQDADEPKPRTVPPVSKAVAALEQVTSLSDIERMQQFADGYYENDEWSDQHMETFNAAADKARARLG